jgi:hypothetical protein
MKGDSYPREFVVLVSKDSNIKIFGNHNGKPFIFKIFEALLQIRLRNQSFHGSNF